MSPSGCTGRRGVRLIVAFCGVTASGKSTVAARVAEASGFPVLSSDRVRKELAGLVPTERGPAERYGEAANRRTYDELGKRASSCARRRGGVIVDLTVRRSSDRRSFVRALGSGASLVLYANAPPRSVDSGARRTERGRPDARHRRHASMVDRQVDEHEPRDEVDPAQHLALRTGRDTVEIVDEREALLDHRIARLGPPRPSAQPLTTPIGRSCATRRASPARSTTSTTRSTFL